MSFKLKELLDEKGYIRGPFGSALRRNELLDEGIPVYEQQNAIYNNREFRYFINNEKYEEMKRFTVRENDLIISCSGTVGRVSVIRKDDPIGIISQALLILRPNTEKVLTDFLFYFFTSRIGYNSIISRSGGSVQANISKRAVIENIDIDVPPLPEQKSIVNILSALDKKIEVNNQINKTLESMAQAIFKQWFVDFEFPNEDGEPYQSSGGEMVESELGMIPKGWEVKKSSDIANVNIGKTPPRKEKECFTLDPDDYKWISIKDLGNSGAYIFDSSEYLTKESIEKYNVKVVPDNTVVLSFKLTVGRVSITCGQMTTNEAIAHFNLGNKSKITTEYLYLYLKSFDYGKLGNTSSIANAVNSKIIKAMPIIVPDNKTIKTFSEVMESVFSKIKYTIKQSDKLIEIRDSLLPKLMSGEIRVPLNEEGDVS
jgi:type I restriction enzyme S subunit